METPPSASTSLRLACLALAPCPKGSECHAPSSHQQCLVSSIASTAASDHQPPYLIDSALRTIQERHKKPSTAGFVCWLDMAWQNFTYVLMWQENQQVQEDINTTVPKAASFKGCMSWMFAFPTATQQCKQVPSFLLLLGKSCRHDKTITASCNVKPIKLSPTLVLPH